MRYGPLDRYVRLRVAHAPGMPETFSPLPWVSDPAMRHGTCGTHVPVCMSASLTSGFLWSRWRGKRSPHSRRMRNTILLFGKRPMSFTNRLVLKIQPRYGLKGHIRHTTGWMLLWNSLSWWLHKQHICNHKWHSYFHKRKLHMYVCIHVICASSYPVVLVGGIWCNAISTTGYKVALRIITTFWSRGINFIIDIGQLV